MCEKRRLLLTIRLTIFLTNPVNKCSRFMVLKSFDKLI